MHKTVPPASHLPPPSHKKNTQKKKLKSANEQGFVLAIVLVTTLVSTIVILNATRTYYGEQRSSTNYADHKYALSLANAALQEGELYVRSKDFENKTFTENCRDGLCSPAGSRAFTNGTMTVRAGPRQRDLLQECQGGSCVIDTSGRKLRGNNSSNGGARYVIEYLGSDEQGSNIPSGGFPHSYRITAKGYGRNGNIQAVVQSYVVTRAPEDKCHGVTMPPEPEPELFMDNNNTIHCGRSPTQGLVIGNNYTYECIDKRNRNFTFGRRKMANPMYFKRDSSQFRQLMGNWNDNKSSNEIPHGQTLMFCWDDSPKSGDIDTDISCGKQKERNRHNIRVYDRQWNIWKKKVDEIHAKTGCPIPKIKRIDCSKPLSDPTLFRLQLYETWCKEPPIDCNQEVPSVNYPYFNGDSNKWFAFWTKITAACPALTKPEVSCNDGPPPGSHIYFLENPGSWEQYKREYRQQCCQSGIHVSQHNLHGIGCLSTHD